MPYSNFTIKRVRDEFGVEIAEREGVFSSTEPHAISRHLREALAENVSLAVSVNTEKARTLSRCRIHGKPYCIQGYRNLSATVLEMRP